MEECTKCIHHGSWGVLRKILRFSQGIRQIRTLCSLSTLGSHVVMADGPMGVYTCEPHQMLSPQLSSGLISDHNPPTLGVPIACPSMHQDDRATINEMPVRSKACVLGLWTYGTLQQGQVVLGERLYKPPPQCHLLLAWGGVSSPRGSPLP